ncbi:ADI_G0039750.mRNA.1.CDS.1 [Saccharomyces cerevisiae]|nr:ADI_G0039750.mRNA.1.CDS.1 [Saccharomyces cerevisiae]CAI6829060.1 ADI_G0039750.mRNA.1.CDS.1 [Saccharomyces cerevisiae]
MDRKSVFGKIVISVMVRKKCTKKFLTFVEDEPDFQGGPIPSKVSYSQEKKLDGLHVVSSAYLKFNRKDYDTLSLFTSTEDTIMS